jgi:hypothetical protein
MPIAYAYVIRDWSSRFSTYAQCFGTYAQHPLMLIVRLRWTYAWSRTYALRSDGRSWFDSIVIRFQLLEPMYLIQWFYLLVILFT